LIDYCGVEDLPYVRAIGPRIMVAAAARVFRPGVQVDTVPIFEGPQGLYKSKALRILAIKDEWYSDQIVKITERDTHYLIAGKLIIEIPEMAALQRASDAAKKHFLTKRSDEFKPPWGKHRVAVPRQCIFAVTLNPPLVGGYLTDATGGRRYWPFLCGEIDLDGLARDRDQLWAEARYLLEANHPWHLETPELEALATAEQDKRYKVDALEPQVRKYLQGRQQANISDLVCHFFGKANVRDQQLANRMQKIVTHIGYTNRVRTRTAGGKRARVYRPNPKVKTKK
jgi:predicted P-loop ATPase